MSKPKRYTENTSTTTGNSARSNSLVMESSSRRQSLKIFMSSNLAGRFTGRENLCRIPHRCKPTRKSLHLISLNRYVQNGRRLLHPGITSYGLLLRRSQCAQNCFAQPSGAGGKQQGEPFCGRRFGAGSLEAH